MRDKVFILSMPKAGTTSTTNFLKQYGYNTMHWIGSKVSIEKISLGDTDFFVNFAEPYDLCSDSPFHVLYPILDKRYPNSKFIFIDRRVDDWVESTIKHRARSGRPMGKMELNALTYEENNYFDGNGVLEYNANDLKRNYLKHKSNVLGYFKNRNDLLIVDLENVEIGQTICNFLDIEYNASKPFPRLNVAPK